MYKNIEKKIVWDNPKIPKEYIHDLLKKDNSYVFTHVFLHLFTLFLTSYFLIFVSEISFTLFIVILMLHGMVYQFLGVAGASHELYHNSPFSMKPLNKFFYYLFSFLLWNNPIIFSRSHKVHHKCSIHSDCDGEIDPNKKFNLKTFVNGIFNYESFINKIKNHFLNSIGKVRGDWVEVLGKNDEDKIFISNVKIWSRLLIIGHMLLASIFIFFGQPLLILIITFGSFFGNLVVILLAMGQHNLMPDKQNDFRKNSRTIILNPIIEFFYWSMNYHIEHSMYPKIPFYNLKKVRSILKQEMPEPTYGIYNLYKILKN